MLNRIKRFAAEEDGAATVDWVVGTAAAVGLGVAAVDTVESGINTLAGNIATAISSKAVNNGDSDGTSGG
jgi:Flp pilus assembly pilin Flp